MKTASIQEIKNALQETTPGDLNALCLRLARYKKENKELLTYLLFEAQDEAAYVLQVKQHIDDQFKEINRSNLYFVKKSLRKILRVTAKHIRYMGSKQAEVELLMYFCQVLKNSGIPIQQSTMLQNLYNNQIKKIGKQIGTLHEDLQYDYQKTFHQLEQ